MKQADLSCYPICKTSEQHCGNSNTGFSYLGQFCIDSLNDAVVTMQN